MTYLTQYLARASAPVTPLQRAHVDEELALNFPGFYGDAAVRVFVEDTSGRTRKRRLLRHDRVAPRVELRISDCVNEIALEFDLSSPGDRENALYKIATLVGALERFRAGLEAEARLAEQREPQGA